MCRRHHVVMTVIHTPLHFVGSTISLPLTNRLEFYLERTTHDLLCLGIALLWTYQHQYQTAERTFGDDGRDQRLHTGHNWTKNVTF